MERTEDQIEEQITEASCTLADNNGRSKYPGMTYEEGVEAALRWVLGEADEKPMDD